MKVIVVDDEINALHGFLDEIIGFDNLEYQFFTDDEEKILGYCKNNEVSAAFLDVRMPNISGIDLAKKLILNNKNIKIVFITGINITENDLPIEIRENILEIIYKPIKRERLEKVLFDINQKTRILELKMFGTFDCFINGHLVNFSSNKSKELFALVCVLNGKNLTMEYAISLLWPNKESEKSKILYRDAVWRLRQTLSEIEFNCVNFTRAQLSLNKANITSDYYDFLSGKDIFYNGEFLNNYEWAMLYKIELDYMVEKRKNSN